MPTCADLARAEGNCHPVSAGDMTPITCDNMD
jgi:hypothetical protein